MNLRLPFSSLDEDAPRLSKDDLGDQHSVPGGSEDTEDSCNIDCLWMVYDRHSVEVLALSILRNS